jgi:hypothetical protein
MFVNPHCIPSRMTVAQLMEMLFGQVCYENSMIGDATLFTSDASAPEAIGRVLEGQFGLEKNNNFILYDGASGKQMETSVFMGPVCGRRLKHMTEDKWNARAEGRREQKTRQPTGGRGQQGGLRIGEMERDGLAAHGISGFLRESLMERADKAQIRICNGCGTVPIYNDQGLFVCSLCDGPVQFIGTNSNNIEILPTAKKSLASSSVVEMPYATKLLADELQTYMNMGLRILTAKGLAKLDSQITLPMGAEIQAALARPLPERVLPETRVPEFREAPAAVEPAEEDLYALGVVKAPVAASSTGEEDEEEYPSYGYVPGEEGRTPEFAVPGSTPLTSTPPYATNLTPPEGSAPAAPAQAGFTGPPLTSTPPYATNLTPPGQTIQQPFVQAGGYQQMMVPAPVMYQMAPMQPMQPMQPMMVPAPMAGGPPTIVIDTGPNVMQQGGFLDELHEAQRGVPVMGRRSMDRRHTTPRARGSSPQARPAQRGGMSFGGEPLSTGQRITVNKI